MTTDQLHIENLLKHLSSIEDEIDNSNLFNYAYIRQYERIQKRKYFLETAYYNVYYLCNPPNLERVSVVHPSIQNQLKIYSDDPNEIFNTLSTERLPSFVILTNNVLAKIGVQGFSEMRKRTPNLAYIIHDYDCHHWYDLSIRCALNSDVYVPAHFKTTDYIKLLINHELRVIPCGSIQWSNEFLVNHLSMIHKLDRPETIRGKHAFYPRFHYRNKLITTFGNYFPSIGFIDANQFHGWSETEKLVDWLKSSLHFIAPVGTDVPIRLYDALCTGGIPVVPQWMHASLASLNIPSTWVQTYGPQELANPKEAVEQWNKNLAKQTVRERQSRIWYSLQNFHVDNTITQLINHAIAVMKS
jgi:hypothetical protein